MTKHDESRLYILECAWRKPKLIFCQFISFLKRRLSVPPVGYSRVTKECLCGSKILDRFTRI